MAQTKGLGHAPGFDPHIFQFGMHLGQQPDLGGVDPQAVLGGNLWDQPYQDPYGGGGGAPPPQMGGNMPSMGGQPPQDPTMPMGQQSPSDDGGGFWHNAGQYLSSDSFKDSLMGGIIAGQMAANPQGALQMAMQWRQHKDQRKFQAEQNQLQRDAVKENIKARAEIEKGNKEQTQYQQRSGKLEAAMRQYAIDPTPWIAENGPLTPDNIDKAETDLNVLVAQKKALEQSAKEVSTDIKNKGAIYSQAAKTGKILQSPYTSPGNPKYDPTMANDLTDIAKNRQGYESMSNDLRAARLAREKALTKIAKKKLSDGTPDTAAKASLQRNLKLFGILEGHIKSAQDKLLEAKATQAAYSSLDDNDPLKINAGKSVETYQASLDDAQKELIDNDQEFQTLTGKESPTAGVGKTIEDTAVPPEAKALLEKYPGAKVTLPKGITMPKTETAPGSDMDLYFKFVDKFGVDKANAAWAERHGNAPPPTR